MIGLRVCGEERKVGFVKTLGNFFKNIVSGLTLGAYAQEGEAKPQGGVGKIKHLFKKVFKDAIVADNNTRLLFLLNKPSLLVERIRILENDQKYMTI